MSKKMLATKLHDALCPKCNNRCHCGGMCDFTHAATTDEDWEMNPANRYFLNLSEKATAIMEETHIDEETFIHYANEIAFDKPIPPEVYDSMLAHNFID